MSKLTPQTMLKRIVNQVHSLRLQSNELDLYELTADLAGGTTNYPGRYVYVKDFVLNSAIRQMYEKVVKDL